MYNSFLSKYIFYVLSKDDTLFLTPIYKYEFFTPPVKGLMPDWHSDSPVPA